MVKTYHTVNSERENHHFVIAKMEAIYGERQGKPDEPHRHDYFTVLVIQKAAGLHKIDFNTYELSGRQVYFVAPGQVHQLMETQPSVGYVMTFSHQFLVQSAIPLSFIDSLNLFQNYGQSPPLIPTAAEFLAISNFAYKMFELSSSGAAMKFLSVGAYLKLLLIECNNICDMNPVEPGGDVSGYHLIRAFKTSVDDNFRAEHSTKFYADALHITPDHLNRTVKSKMGKTAKEYIQARIVTEAKRLLFFTAQSTKEIAYELGFKEPANFSAFFKKHTQLPPTAFKKSEAKAIKLR
ncbi:Transcriptional regulator, AraC family [Croceitalea dokdonensis DOKDO 023]|uniref:Transcriptional regulator, AraC family n=1 Tax=Croceitalea dokdonensis DOKDO 023 TaxID=1300341 RepID=A0A0P7AXH9_9FLAO|nr:helix-turn-helix transcriptional regulator [Croceitalea dokdonensis]KPM32757.1 Transcriptional regulator, AraC family [Croceitalea dokdonensis DOKDO 023]